MHYIELTDSVKGIKVLVNLGKANHFSEYHDSTIVCFDGEDDYLLVKETYSEIKMRIASIMSEEEYMRGFIRTNDR